MNITLDAPQLFYIKKPYYDVAFVMDRRHDIIVKQFDFKQYPFCAESAPLDEVKRLTQEAMRKMFL